MSFVLIWLLEFCINLSYITFEFLSLVTIGVLWQYEFLSFVTNWYFKNGIIWFLYLVRFVVFCDNLRLCFVTNWVLEFGHNFSLWVLPQFQCGNFFLWNKFFGEKKKNCCTCHFCHYISIPNHGYLNHHWYVLLQRYICSILV